jgi:disulfide bond formation protein DsbB
MDLLTLNWLVSVGAVLMQVITIALIAVYLLKDTRAQTLIAPFALPGASLIAVAGLVLSLVYSEYYGVVPCGLCWVERVFLYPLAFILPLAWMRRDTGIAFYGIVLAGIGLLISLYHHYIQMSGGHGLPCPASDVGDCAKRIIFEFGYVTFPLIAFTSFALIIALLLFVRRQSPAV